MSKKIQVISLMSGRISRQRAARPAFRFAHETENVGPNLGPLTPEHQGEPASPLENVMRHIIPGRGIPAGGVAHPSNIPDILGLRAWPSGRRAPGLMQRITFPGD